MKRRLFLAALIAAPAIVRAESLMRVRPTLSAATGYADFDFSVASRVLLADFGEDSWFAERFTPADGVWRHVALVRQDGFLFTYVNGVLAPSTPGKRLFVSAAPAAVLPAPASRS